jgi:hypothetical protein
MCQEAMEMLDVHNFSGYPLEIVDRVGDFVLLYYKL